MSVLQEFTYQFQPAAAPDLPTLLLLHGTGGNEDDLLPLGRLLCADAALLSPRGRVVEHGMPRFFRRLAEGVFDLDDVRARAGELAGFVAAAAETHAIDPARIVAVGYSNGANIAHATALLYPSLFEALVLLHPQHVLTPDPLPSLESLPAFISAGDRDPIVPRIHVEALVDVLTQAGARVTTHWLAGGHSLSREETELARDWLACGRGRPGAPA